MANQIDLALVKAAMEADYATWNVVIETYEDAELAEALGAVTTVKGALKKLKPIVNGWNEGRLNSEAHLHEADGYEATAGRIAGEIMSLTGSQLKLQDEILEEFGMKLEDCGEQETRTEGEIDAGVVSTEPRVEVKFNGWVVGYYAYSAGEVQGKTRWFDLRKTAIVEGQALSDPAGLAPKGAVLGVLTARLSVKDAKKRGLIAQ